MAQNDHDLVVVRDIPGEGEGRRIRRTVLFRSHEGPLVGEQLTLYENPSTGVVPGQLVVQRMDSHFPRRRTPGSTIRLLGVLVCVLSMGFFCGTNRSIAPGDYVSRTKHVMSSTPLIDGHNDMPYLIRIELRNHIYDKRFTFREGLLSPTDLIKLRTGGVGGQFWSAYMPCDDRVADNFHTPTVSAPTPLNFASCRGHPTPLQLTFLHRICFGILWSRSMSPSDSLRSTRR